MTEIRYEVREKDLIAFNEHLLDSSERIQKVIRRHQAIIPGIIAVIALILFFYFKDTLSAVYALVLSIGWGAAIPFYLKWNMRKQIRQSYSEKEKAGIIGRYTLTANRDGLEEIKDDGEPSQLAWKNILRAEVERKYVFVFISLDSALIIPRETLSKDSNLHEFVKAVDENIEKTG